MDKQQRPVFLDLPKLGFKMSVTAIVSILHRVSGVLMFLALPFVLALFHKSLTSAQFYESCYAFAALPIVKLIYLVLLWGLIHHVCAGIRFLFLDVHVGIGRLAAQKTARIVMVVSLLLTVVAGVMLW